MVTIWLKVRNFHSNIIFCIHYFIANTHRKLDICSNILLNNCFGCQIWFKTHQACRCSVVTEAAVRFCPENGCHVAWFQINAQLNSFNTHLWNACKGLSQIFTKCRKIYCRISLFYISGDINNNNDNVVVPRHIDQSQNSHCRG